MFDPMRPPLPAASTNSMHIAQRILSDPLSGTRAMSANVRNDPLLCAAVLREANSAAYGQRAVVGTVARALEVIGLERTRSVAMRVVMQQIVHAIEVPAARSVANLLWTHCVTTASIAEQLHARDQRALDSALDYQRAILHELPALIFLGYSRERPALFPSIAEIRQLIWRHQVPTHEQIALWLGIPENLLVRSLVVEEPIEPLALAHHLCPVDSAMESIDTAQLTDVDANAWLDHVQRGVQRAREILFQQ